MFFPARKLFAMAVLIIADLSLVCASTQAQPDFSNFDPGPAIGRGFANMDPGPAIGRGFANIDPGPGLGNAFDPNPQPGRDFTRLHVRNGTNRRIHVAVRLVPFSRTPTSEPSHLSGAGGGGGSVFDTRAWYTLFPNQEAYVGDSMDNNVYTFAHDDFGNQWAGNDYQQVYEGGQPRSVGFRWHIYGISQTDYTVNFR